MSQPVSPVIDLNTRYRIVERDVYARMEKAPGIPTAAHYPLLLNLQPAFASWHLSARDQDVIIGESVTARSAVAA